MHLDLTKPTTQSAFAQLVGIGPRSVTNLLSRGIIRRNGTAGEWLLMYANHLREVAAARQSADGSLDLVAERAALTLEQRHIASIKRRELEGTLIEKAGVKAAMGRRIREFSDSLLTIPARMAPALASKSIHETQTLLDAELRHTITAFVAGLEPTGDDHE